MYKFPFENIEIFNFKDLNKKVGQILVISDTDSDIQEKGYLSEQVWFFTEDRKMYLIHEEIIK